MINKYKNTLNILYSRYDKLSDMMIDHIRLNDKEFAEYKELSTVFMVLDKNTIKTTEEQCQE